MSKIMFLIRCFSLLVIFHFHATAQTGDTTAPVRANEDYFVGKWKTMILGIPQGDREVTFTFEKKEGKLVGTMVETKQNISADFTNVKVVDGVLTSNITVQGYYASLSLRKRDSASFAGSVMEQFDVIGARIK